MHNNNQTYKVPNIYSTMQKNTTSCLTVNVPGSKSITNRALLLSTLANGTSTLRGVLFSDDSRHFLKCIQDLGFSTSVDEINNIISVTGHSGTVPLKEASQYVGSAGTAARFLTAYLGISNGTYYMDASEQMRKRPMLPLLESLKELGCDIVYGLPDQPSTTNEGFFPFTLKGNGFKKSEISINIKHSSQFLSALLIASCLCENDFKINVEGTHGMSYINMTQQMMQQFGVITKCDDNNCFTTKSGQSYKALDYQIEPDVSAACYFYAMAPILNISVQVEYVHFDSLQGDVEFLRILEKLGCIVTDEANGILVTPPADGVYEGITVDMSACSDQAITLAAIAPFAQSPTKITGIGHIRYQESNRIKAIVTELDKMGIVCQETEDSITINPGIPKASLVETYDDHRMAMGFSLIGLRSDGIVINDPLCCRKTFENYFDVLNKSIEYLLNT